ncbi:hypothetical protein D9757_000473 [Collybiopsis confluens]|uniref:Uncharacterized protein n=1 Tax=Collybiopsis confluens TaxID=2823264 RepID=A0A8H5I1I9_9AGAR|nr:hypothetical protein D9757_000473 [Collybiopsis confluens]
MLRPAIICTRPLCSFQSVAALSTSTTTAKSPISWRRTYTVRGTRGLSMSHKARNSASSPQSQSPEGSSSVNKDPNLIYEAPLTSTFRRLKTFSLASLALSTSFAPLIFIIESQLPFFARSVLAFLAVGTSSISTALVAWVAKPYVTTLRRLDPISNGGGSGLELVTATWTLRKRITRVYDSSFLTTTTRPFAKWQLANEMTLPSLVLDEATIRPSEETVAETFDGNGNLVGSWVVTWDAEDTTVGSESTGGEGKGAGGLKGRCRAVGSVVRHFQVHPELFETTER